MTITNSVTRASSLAPAQRDDHAHEDERDRVVDQVLEAGVDERRGEDPPEAADVARMQPVGSRSLESSVLITSTTHISATIPASSSRPSRWVRPTLAGDDRFAVLAGSG